MEDYVKIIKDYQNISFHYNKGKIDIFYNKQFHHYYEIYLLIGGEAEYISDLAKAKISPFSLVIIPPGRYHHFTVPEGLEGIYERCILNVQREFLPGSILDEALREKDVITLKPESRTVQNFLYLKDASQNTDEKDFSYILSAVATDIIFLIKQMNYTRVLPSKTVSHPISQRIIGFINDNYKTNITLKDISNKFYLSVSSVCHIFKEDFGVSIKKYITEKRMNEIYTCIQKGKKPQEVSNDFGFSNYSTFYRSYLKHFGIPPSKTKKTKTR